MIFVMQQAVDWLGMSPVAFWRLARMKARFMNGTDP